jgi:hypothetical protein
MIEYLRLHLFVHRLFLMKLSQKLCILLRVIPIYRSLIIIYLPPTLILLKFEY